MSKIDNYFPYPTPIPAKIWGVPLGVDPLCWSLQRKERLGYSIVSAVKLFSKNSNVCDHNPPTLQTDRQTTYHGNTALRYASSGKKRQQKSSPMTFKAQYTPPTRRNCFVPSASAVWTQFATSSRRLPTDSVDNFETDQTDSIAFDYTNFDKYW